MDPCHIAQFLHLVTPQGVRRRDVPAHIYITSTFKHTLHTTAIIHTGSTHILTPVFHTSEYRFLGGSDARALQPVAPPVQLKVSRINSY